MGSTLDSLLKEDRHFEPPADFVENALVTDPEVYRRADADPQAFWAGWARELEWFEDWKEVLRWNPPHAEWFVGGKLNAAHNCLDRHLSGSRRTKTALIWEGEPGEQRRYTYEELHREVSRAANALKALGVGKGDRVAIYLPMIPEAAIAMLACARIGAPHSVVFGGFSADSLRNRIRDAEARVLITADGGYRRGKVVPLKTAADEAITEGGGCASIDHVLVVRRHGESGERASRTRPCGRGGTSGGTRWWVAPAPTARPSRWTRRTSSTSSTPPAPPGSRRESCTPPAAT